MNKPFRWLAGCVICACLTAFSPAFAKAVPGPGNSVEFFMTIADKMLRNTFSFGITNIPVCSNGVMVYTPAVQRLLQLSANVCDASTPNFYPSVFRPLFADDGASNIFIIGFQQVTNVSGPLDPLLSVPHDINELQDYFTNGTPIADANGPVNVYGVPWILGARKGFPNFNKFGLENFIQITRRLQIARNTLFPTSLANFIWTNQLYAFGISNTLGVEFWNSYTNAYPNAVSITVRDTLSMEINNDRGLPSTRFYRYLRTTNFVMAPGWPGQAVSPTIIWTAFLLNNSDWYFGTAPPGVAGFWPDSANYGWERTHTGFDLPKFTLLTTNTLQAFMLDSSDGIYRVIDYVQIACPASARQLNDQFQVANMATSYDNMWATNEFNDGLPQGIENQILASMGRIPLNISYWKNPTLPLMIAEDEITGFCGFMGLALPYPVNNPAVVQSYVTNLVVQVPYTPTATIYDYASWQANDPLVHYLASDLAFAGTELGGAGPTTGIQKLPDNNSGVPLPTYAGLNDRYQPWGTAAPLLYRGMQYNFTNAYNLLYKDPLVWSSDCWNFPTNLTASLAGLGQVHRGTPWQTVYLKSGDILNTPGSGSYPNSGTNTWLAWTGDWDTSDAILTAPVRDWRLADLLTTLLNTNDVITLFSANEPSAAGWLNVLNGLSVYSNTTVLPLFSISTRITPVFEADTISSNSAAAFSLANDILQAKADQPTGYFRSFGDILSAPELTEDSPWLITSAPNQRKLGITDAAYEALPAQLMPMLRPDSFGQLSPGTHGYTLQFSGSDACAYVLQTSADLVHWQAVSTNHPVQGSFSVPVSAGPGSAAGYYRSVLLP